MTVACCVALLVAVVPADSRQWPAFLGSGATAGAVAESQLPLEWSPEHGISWQAEIPGHGQSSPVVWGDHVFVTSVEGPKKETYHTLCVNLSTGQVEWARDLANSTPIDNSLYVSRAAPTPVVDAQRVVVFFESGGCVAYSHSGEILWTRDLAKDYGPFIAEFGLGASPCQTDDRVYVLLEHDGPSHLVALDKQTGQTVWQVDRTPRRSWSSPAVLDVGGAPQIVVSSAGSIDGYSTETGELLWTYNQVGGNTGTTPIDCGDGKFLVGASAGQQGENAEEAKISNCLMQVSQEGTQWRVDKLWMNQEVSPSWASPIMHQGLAYWINRGGVVSCLDANTGEMVYKERSKQSCWATPIAVGERIYLFGKDGVVSVLASGREFKLLAENALWSADDPPLDASLQTQEKGEQRQRAAAMFGGATLYGAAIVDQAIIARIGNRLYCIQ